MSVHFLEHFYAEGVIFDGSMARCAWEVDVDLESGSDLSNHEEPVEAQDKLKTFWSKDSDAEMDFTKLSVPNPAWEQYSSCNATWAVGLSIRSPSPSLIEPLKIYESSSSGKMDFAIIR